MDASDLITHGITIQTRMLPPTSPWRIHGAWVADVVVSGKVVSRWLGETQADAAGLAVDAAADVRAVLVRLEAS